MKKWNFDDIIIVIFAIIFSPILILVFGLYGVIKTLCSNEDDEYLCDE